MILNRSHIPRKSHRPDMTTSSTSHLGDGERGWCVVPTAISSHLPFSAAVEANGFIFVSGQASVDELGKIVSGDFEQEMRRSIANVQRILGSAGLDLGDVVRVTSYVHDPAHVPQYNTLYREFFSAPFPARTTITSCLSVALKFEIDVIAVRRPAINS